MKQQSIYGINTTGCLLGCILPLSKVICHKLTRGKQVLRHVLIASANHVTVVQMLIFRENVLNDKFKQLFTVIISFKRTARGIYTKSALSVCCTLMILHLSRMRRNVNQNVYNNLKNVSATMSYGKAFCATNQPKQLTSTQQSRFALRRNQVLPYSLIKITNGYIKILNNLQNCIPCSENFRF